jgi:predicted nucleotidyltransferase
MAFDLEKVKSTVKTYADEIRQILLVGKVFLYGSYVKGSATEYSDVDVCFFNSFGDETWDDIMIKLFNLSYKYKLDIEPNVFEVSDFYTDNPFVKEMLSTGIEIH